MRILLTEKQTMKNCETLTPTEEFELGHRETWTRVFQRLFEVWATNPSQTLALSFRMVADDGLTIKQELIEASPCLSHPDQYLNGIMSVFNELDSIHIS